MDNDVDSMLDGADHDGGEGVVDDEHDAMAVGHLGYGLQMGHVAIGVAEGLGIDHLGVGLDGRLERLQVVYVQDGVADALRREGVGDEVERAAIEVVGCDDVVARLEHVLQRIGNGGCSAGHGQCGYASFEGGDALLEHRLRGVGQSAIDVARVAQAEAVGGMLGVMKHVGGGLIDGHGP